MIEKMSQRKTAKLAGIAFDRYWRIENGYQVPTISEALNIARVLKTDVPSLGFEQVA